ncbi:MAG: hypothetical protein WBW99_13055, partial [Pseudolabrys sp.]
FQAAIKIIKLSANLTAKTKQVLGANSAALTASVRKNQCLCEIQSVRCCIRVRFNNLRFGDG